LQIEDKNRQNNAASVKMFGANLALANVSVNKTQRGDFYITADVVNNGFIAVPACIEFDLRTPDGTVTLDKQLVAALEPCEFHTITLLAPCRDLAYGESELKLIVDADNMIEETSKMDNVRIISAYNNPPFDIDNNRVVDTSDFAIFAMHWQRNDCAEPHWCGGADFDLSGSVGIVELANLAENWLKKF
jgi:hypothetical protein